METNNKSFIGRIRSLGWGFAAMLFIGGILFWGAFNTAMEWTNREAFCISCHEMKDNVYEEYRNTIHASNRSGVRATCPDCHVPKEWGPKMIRKIQASNEVLHKILGTIDTPEKFNAKRLELAKHEWERMKKTDSASAATATTTMASTTPSRAVARRRMHQTGLNEGKTCIDCHKGIAHSLPQVEQAIGAPKEGATPEEFHPTTPKPAEAGKDADKATKG
jgi:cytochrome c-type protein NapC